MRRRPVIWTLACLVMTCAVMLTPLAGEQKLSLLFSTPLTGGGPVRVAVDPQGYIYLAGSRSAPEPPAAFVMKLAPSRAVVYTTYLQGTRSRGEPGDCGVEIYAIAVDRTGAAYVTGCTGADDFPVVNAFRPTRLGARSSPFVAKLNPAGGVVYSTYFGSGGFSESGIAIAADDDGNAYVAGTATGRDLPLVSPASRNGPGFVAKFGPSGSSLLYSTYIGTRPRAMAIDRPGAVYIAGTSEGGSAALPAVRPIQDCHAAAAASDAVVIKLHPSGSWYEYATCLGGSGEDSATGIAVDASGSAYVVGRTSSIDFPAVRPLDRTIRTGPLFRTDDGGVTWRTLPLYAYNVQRLTPPASSGTWYAATLTGAFASVDGNADWHQLPLPLRDGRYAPSVFDVAVNPRTPATIYASTSDGLFRSTDGGNQWVDVGAFLPFRGVYLRIGVSPADSRVAYAGSQHGFWKSTDGGASWRNIDRGLDPDARISLLTVDPLTGTLFADVTAISRAGSVDRVFMSIDGGETWTPTPLEISQRSVAALEVSRSRPAPDGGPGRLPRSGFEDVASRASVYVAVQQVFSDGPYGGLFRSDDQGETWLSIGRGLPSAGPAAIAVAPSNPAIVYAASRGTLYVSSDRGDTFTLLWRMSDADWIRSLAVDPRRPASVFAGTTAHPDAFVTRIRPGGGALEYSTTLGGVGEDAAAGVVVDDLGNAIVFGSTESDDFPVVSPFQNRRRESDAFVATLNSGGSVLLFSTWLGGPGHETVASAARFQTGVLLSGGTTDLAGMFPDSDARGAGAFVVFLDALLRTR